MKFENSENSLEVLGEIQENKVGIDASNLDFIVSILSTNLYTDSVGSFLRETVSNAFDSHIEAGTDDPVTLILDKDADENYYCEIRDFGVGLSKERFEKIYRNIGSSTKRDSNDMIGGFGIGRFAALAYSNTVNITSIYEGIKTQYLMYKDGTSLNISEIFSIPTEEGNGVTVRIPVKVQDVSLFLIKIAEQLSYFNNLFISTYNKDFDDIFNNQNIVSRNSFKFLSKEINSSIVTYKKYLRILLGKVVYPIPDDIFNNLKLRLKDLKNFEDYVIYNRKIPFNPYYNKMLNLLFINKGLDYIDFVLKFEIGELNVVPNREQILVSSNTLTQIENKFYDLVIELVDRLKVNTLDFKDVNEYSSNLVSIPYYNLVEDKIVPFKSLENKWIKENSNILYKDKNLSSLQDFSDEYLIILLHGKKYDFNFLNYFTQNINFSSLDECITTVNIESVNKFNLKAGIRKYYRNNQDGLSSLFSKENTIVINRNTFDNLKAKDRRFIYSIIENYNRNERSIYVLEKPFNTWRDLILKQDFKGKVSIRYLYLSYLRYKFGLTHLVENNVTLSKIDKIDVRGFVRDINNFYDFMESHIRGLLKERYVKKIEYTQDFIDEEDNKSRLRKQLRGNIDYNEVFNITYPVFAGWNDYDFSIKTANFSVEGFKTKFKKGITVYSSKDDESLRGYLDTIYCNSAQEKYRKGRRLYSAIGIAKTKIKRLDQLSLENPKLQLYNIETMLQNPQQFRQITEIGTIYRVLLENQIIFNIRTNESCLKIIEQLKNSIYEDFKDLNKIANKYNIDNINPNKDLGSIKNKAITFAKQCYEVCVEHNLWNYSLLAASNNIKKHTDAIEHIYEISEGYKHYFKNSYSYGNDEEKILNISKSLAKLFIKTKMLRPDFKNFTK